MLRITASFDDGSPLDVELGALLTDYGIPVTFYWPVNWQKYNAQRGRPALSSADAYDLAKQFEIGSHGIAHQLLTRVLPGVAAYEVIESRKALQDMFSQPIKKFCYPRGYYNADTLELVKEAGYESARTTLVGRIYPPEDPLQTHTAVHLACDRNEYAGLPWHKYARKLLQEAVDLAVLSPEREFEFHIWGHGYEIEQNQAWPDLLELMEHINAVYSEL